MEIPLPGITAKFRIYCIRVYSIRSSATPLRPPFGLDLWDAVRRGGLLNRRRQQHLEDLNVWRNAIAHQDFTDRRLGGRTAALLGDVQTWRRACEALAMEFDAVVGAHLATILGANPW